MRSEKPDCLPHCVCWWRKITADRIYSLNSDAEEGADAWIWVIGKKRMLSEETEADEEHKEEGDRLP